MTHNTLNALIVLTSIVIIVIVTINKRLKNKCKYNEKLSKENLHKLLRQTARWATAADQDTNPYITNLHATYAMGYLMALREIYTDEYIMQISGIDIRKLNDNINNIMDKAILKLTVECPPGQPKKLFLASIAKEGKLLF